MPTQNRGLYLAAALFIIAVAAFYIYDKGQGSKAPGSSPSASPTVLASPIVTLDPNQIAEVDVKSTGKTLTVNRNATSFTYSLCASGQANCASAPADTNLSGQLFLAVVQLRPTRTIYGVSDQLPNFGLDKATTAEIDIKVASGETTILWVGAKAPDGVSYYVRQPDKGDVYAIPASSIDGPILGLVTSPPAPQPTPSPQSATSPAAAPNGPGLASP